MSAFDRDGKHYGYTQPVCVMCWISTYPGRTPVRAVYEYRSESTCCLCGALNMDGILTRIDPEGVPHPQPEDD